MCRDHERCLVSPSQTLLYSDCYVNNPINKQLLRQSYLRTVLKRLKLFATAREVKCRKARAVAVVTSTVGTATVIAERPSYTMLTQDPEQLSLVQAHLLGIPCRYRKGVQKKLAQIYTTGGGGAK